MPDPRHAQQGKIKPPTPLPHVSRKALKRVRDWMPPPTVCNCCGGERVELVNNSEIYNGRSYGKWPFAYLCRDCRAYVGLHPDTDLPLGTLADVAIREARKLAKAQFHHVVNRFFKRDRVPAYLWLAAVLQIDDTVCHFAMFDEYRSYQALRVCYIALLEGSLDNPEIFEE